MTSSWERGVDGDETAENVSPCPSRRPRDGDRGTPCGTCGCLAEPSCPLSQPGEERELREPSGERQLRHVLRTGWLRQLDRRVRVGGSGRDPLALAGRGSIDRPQRL